LVQSSFLLLDLNAVSKILPFNASDHKPILLEFTKDSSLGPIPFRFSPSWIQHEDFHDLVNRVWKIPVTGSPFFVWEEKLRRMKRALKDWAKSLKSPAAQRVEAQQQLEIHQLSMEEGNPNPNSLEKETTLHRKLHAACREEEDYWRQKSRSLWLKAGDKNTNFFHKQAEARKQFNSVKEIHSQNQIVNDFESIKQAAHLHFKGIYTEDSTSGIHQQVLNLIPSVVRPRSNQQLIEPVTLKEIKLALDSMDSE
jgi:hypothetical protein